MRVKTLQKKLDEHKASLISPIPSPDVNAPSPTSDSDIDLPDESKTATIINQTKGIFTLIWRYILLQLKVCFRR